MPRTDSPTPDDRRPAPLRWLQQAAPALLVASMGLAATFVACRTVRGMEQNELETEFSSVAGERCTWVRKALADHLNDLASVRGLFDASASVELSEFEAFVEPLVRRRPSIHALEWIPKVRGSQRQAWVQAARAEGLDDYRIRELNATGTLVTAADGRNDYFPVYFVVPRRANTKAQGFDLASNPARREALERSRDSGRPVATSSITLVQEQDRRRGFLIFMPQYRPGAALETTAQRRQALEGFVLGVYQADDLMEATLAIFRPVGVQLSLQQVNGGLLDVLATYRPPGSADATRSDLPPPVQVPFSFADRDWLLTASATPTFMENRTSVLPWVTGGGLIFTALLTTYFVMLMGRATAVERIVVQRTTELARRDEDMERTNALLTAMTQAQSQFIADDDPRDLFDSMLSSVLAVTGSEYGFIGQILHEDDGTPFLRTFAITNIAWDEETRAFYDKHASAGLEFRKLETLFGRTIADGDAVISNDPANDPRRGGLPKGHPPLNRYLGMPFHIGAEMVGMVGIANRPGGYDAEQIEHLQPLLATCASIIDGYRNAERRRAAEASLHALNNVLTTTNRTLEERNREIVQLTYAITHDLQTPLATLRGSVNSLAHRLPELNDDQAQWLGRIKRSAERMVTMLNDLMIYAKAGSANQRRETVDVAMQVGLAADELRPAADEKGLTLVAECRPCLARGDARVLLRVVLNLIGNAIKYHDGARVGQVTVRTEPLEDVVRIVVEDDGPGIDPLRLEEVFQPFKRAALRETGTGLGLAIVRKSLQSMGGRVWLESDGQSGTKAVIELPAAAAGASDVQRGTDHSGKAAAA